LEDQIKDISKKLIEENTLKLELKEEAKDLERNLDKTGDKISSEKVIDPLTHQVTPITRQLCGHRRHSSTSYGRSLRRRNQR
jgi:hypothetical protein